MPHDFMKDLLPGVFGSAGALFWLGGGWKRLMGMFALGIVFAHYLGTWLAEWAGVSVAATGLVVGFFSMAIADRIFHAIERLDFLALLDKFIDTFLGFWGGRKK